MGFLRFFAVLLVALAGCASLTLELDPRFTFLIASATFVTVAAVIQAFRNGGEIQPPTDTPPCGPQK